MAKLSLVCNKCGVPHCEHTDVLFVTKKQFMEKWCAMPENQGKSSRQAARETGVSKDTAVRALVSHDATPTDAEAASIPKIGAPRRLDNDTRVALLADIAARPEVTDTQRARDFGVGRWTAHHYKDLALTAAASEGDVLVPVDLCTVDSCLTYAQKQWYWGLDEEAWIVVARRAYRAGYFLIVNDAFQSFKPRKI